MKQRTVVLCTAVLIAASAPAVSQAAVTWIQSPSGNLGCEVADRYAGITRIYCQSWNKPHTVRMGLKGGLRMCRGTRCLGNPPPDMRKLPYGRTVTVGRFRCTSLRAGIRCHVRSTGWGFLVDREGVRKLRLPVGRR